MAISISAIAAAAPHVTAETGKPVNLILQERIGSLRPGKGDEAAKKLYGSQFPEWSSQDTQVDEALIKNSHLVVWGGTDVNAFCARVADKLPVKIEKGKFTIGSRVYDQPGQSVRFLCPNPLNPQRYLIVYAWNDFKTAAAGGFHGAVLDSRDAAADAPARPDPTTITSYFRLLAGLTSFISKRWLSHFCWIGPSGILASSSTP